MGRKAKPLQIAEGEGDTRKMGAQKFAQKVGTDSDGESLTFEPELTGWARFAWICITNYLRSRGMDRESDAPALLLMAQAFAVAMNGPFNASAAKVAASLLEGFGGTPAGRAGAAFAMKKDGPVQRVEKMMKDLEGETPAVQ